MHIYALKKNRSSTDCTKEAPTKELKITLEFNADELMNASFSCVENELIEFVFERTLNYSLDRKTGKSTIVFVPESASSNCAGIATICTLMWEFISLESQYAVR